MISHGDTDNELALSYGFMMIALYFGVAVLIWGCWVWVYDILLGTMINPSIVSYDLSMQTRNAIDWNVNVLRYAPPLILILGFIFAANRAAYKKQGG